MPVLTQPLHEDVCYQACVQINKWAFLSDFEEARGVSAPYLSVGISLRSARSSESGVTLGRAGDGQRTAQLRPGIRLPLSLSTSLLNRNIDISWFLFLLTNVLIVSSFGRGRVLS